MPHAIIDYSANLTPLIADKQIVPLVHRIMGECGLFEPDNIKTRATAAADYAVGTKGPSGSFVHVIVYLLQGRSPEQKAALSNALIAALRDALPGVTSITADIRDMDRATYGKG